MIALTPQNIRLRAASPTKEDAIRAAGKVLVESGAIKPGYVESMLGRERQANTYLGNGIAIPHGLQQDRALINRTAVSVVQVPGGVEWNPGQTVRLVVGIAALSDEHIGILSALTDVLDDPASAERLAHASDPAEIIAGLTRRDEKAVSAEGGAIAHEGATALSREVAVAGNAGLHARPATLFSDLARSFESEINVAFGARTANGKSMASLLKLGVACGGIIRISAAGPDAAAALDALVAAVKGGLGDEVDGGHPEGKGARTAGNGDSDGAQEQAPELVWHPVSEGHRIGGVSASPGIAVARVFQYQTARIVVKDCPGETGKEELAFRQAVAEAGLQITRIHDSVQHRAGKAEAGIFRAHLALLNDEELAAEVLMLIDAGHSAAWSWQSVIGKRVEELQHIENERLAERAADLHDVGQRVLRLLSGAGGSQAAASGDRLAELADLSDGPVILVADDLSPSDTARLDPTRIAGLCTASGGPTSHTAIIARSLDIPAVVGAGASVLEIADGEECILEATAGLLFTEPSREDLDSARAFHATLRERRNVEFQRRFEPALMTDGHRVEVSANIGKVAEAAAAVEMGAEGVGLMRTEFLFLGRDTPPSEDEQYEAYAGMIRALHGLPLILRTLDIGGDKMASYISLPREDNPFLGVRGIRLCLRQPEIFLPQLRAIYRASALGPVRIMFPMITTLEDLRAARELAEQVRLETGAAPVEIGIMVEVPSTVLMADEFAREVDFFSIGTNDLTQYTMAMDRLHASLGKNVDGLHPAVLRMVDMTVRGAEKHGKWVGVCGGVAGDPLGAVILSGLGVSELSMSLPSIPSVKAALRGVSQSRARELAGKALACCTAMEVRQLLPG
ncbi:phosphoenolpyruvate--protein phosphotransferase [Verrucomicrobia bacterium LW23]|nr:phosphoenolpyruvate--protein phosphotransferase [Verrucomicrobia bacterium LW23]